jgi:hypothetical protein
MKGSKRSPDERSDIRVLPASIEPIGRFAQAKGRPMAKPIAPCRGA